MRRPRVSKNDPIAQILGGVLPDPRRALGPLDGRDGVVGEGPAKASRNDSCTVRVFLPSARAVALLPRGAESPRTGFPFERVHREGIFEVHVSPAQARRYRLLVEWESGAVGEIEDPYRFEPSLTSAELAPFAAGSESRLQERLGAHVATRDGVEGVRFSVWAPRAIAVNLMGSFNGWEARCHPMFPVPETGVWELFLPGVKPGALYKFQVRPRPATSTDDVPALEKADPLGRRGEVRPRSASEVVSPSAFAWSDAAWVASRPDRAAPGRPISIYEVHLGSWRRNEDGSWLGYRQLADTLLPYVKDLGFTHVELLPITEHPHDASWGYQTVGYFAPTSRYGEPDDFRAFVDAAHGLGLGVLLDWVPAHFPLDGHGLARFDGGSLYEHADPRRGAHPDWGTAIFDYGRPEVRSFLVSSARFWIDEYHLDGLRVDAVASMLYLDYSRAEGEWEPNELGGRENLEAVDFVRQLTDTLREACPGALLFAEESTAWAGITRPTADGGLGFHFKWNMGWMNDTLSVFTADPHRRAELHERLTFSLYYAHAERHVLPLSHDEVVHLKRSLISKIPGGYDAKFEGLRLLLGYMWTHPGAKLLFMGGELAEWSEWNEAGQLSWDLLDHPPHRGVQRWVRALNERYVQDPAWHGLDERPEGFEWIDVHDAARSVLTYVRWAPGWKDHIVVVANFAGRTRRGYAVGLPAATPYRIALDSDAPEFGGKGRARLGVETVADPLHDRPARLAVDLPPSTLLVLVPAARDEARQPA